MSLLSEICLVTEAAYRGNIGVMEMVKFYQLASPEQKALMRDLIAQHRDKEAWALLQSVTGVKLK